MVIVTKITVIYLFRQKYSMYSKLTQQDGSDTKDVQKSTDLESYLLMVKSIYHSTI